MIAIKRHRAQLVAIVLAGDGQNWERYFLELLPRRHHRVVISVGGRVFHNSLKVFRGVADERVERAERDMFFVGAKKFCPPEFAVAKKILLAGFTAGGSEPLHVVKESDVVEARIIVGRMRGRGRNDRGQMRWKFFRGRPLIESGIRAAPHRDFPIAKRLLGQPFDHVVAVARLLCERLELAGGISAPANIDQRKDIAVRREISSTRVIGVGDVRREGEDNRCFGRGGVGCFWEIKCRV